MIASDELAAAQRRIRAAYDPLLLEKAGHRLVELLVAHLDGAERAQGPVLPWVDPPEGIARAASLLHPSSGECEDDPAETWAGGVPASDASCGVGPSRTDLSDDFAQLVKIMLERGLNLHDPRYIGHQVPAPVPLAGLFDAVGSVTNQCMAIYEMGPWATAVEQAMIQELGAAIGWAPGTFAGAVTHGGSLANLTALLTARNVALGDVWERGLAGDGPQPVLVAHADAHYSVARAAGILGLGSRQIVRVGLDELGRMDPQQLDDQLTLLAGPEPADRGGQSPAPAPRPPGLSTRWRTSPTSAAGTESGCTSTPPTAARLC